MAKQIVEIRELNNGEAGSSAKATHRIITYDDGTSSIQSLTWGRNGFFARQVAPGSLADDFTMRCAHYRGEI